MSLSPMPQLPGSSLLTKKRPFPRTGVGQKSSAVELTGSPRFCGAPQGALVPDRRATQMSSPPTPSGRFEAMYRLRPSGDWIGQPSIHSVFSSSLLPSISSIFCAGLHSEKWGPAEAMPASTTTMTNAPASAAAWDADLFMTTLPPPTPSASERTKPAAWGHPWKPRNSPARTLCGHGRARSGGRDGEGARRPRLARPAAHQPGDRRTSLHLDQDRGEQRLLPPDQARGGESKRPGGARRGVAPRLPAAGAAR